jgi:hypothetical protein
MFQLPCLVTMSIAATRMHRSLTDFVSNSTVMYDALPFSFPAPAVDDNLQNSPTPSNVSKLQRIQTPFNRLQITVDTSNESYQMPQRNLNHHEP